MSQFDPPPPRFDPPVTAPPMHEQNPTPTPKRINKGHAMKIGIAVLRGLCSLLSLTSFIIIVTVKNFNKVDTYNYVLAVALISFIYNNLQTSKLIYDLVIRKELIPHKKISGFTDIVGDQVIIFMLGSASSAGLAVSNEGKKLAEALFLQPRLYQQEYDKTATAGSMLLMAFATLVFPSLHSIYSVSIALITSSSISN